MTEPLKVLILAAEVVPFAKTGHLAEVVGSLPKALKKLGVDVRVAMPRYGRVDPERFGLQHVTGPFDVPMDQHQEPVNIWEATIDDDVPVYFVDNARYLGREGIYGYPDDGERFVLFCRGAVEMLKRLDWVPDVIHCHDWHTAIIPQWLKTLYRDDPFFAHTATVYTIHNLAYQGIFGTRILEIAGIDEYHFQVPQIRDLENVVDLMAQGILFADAVNTVSPTYAQEILTPEYGEKLDLLLRDRKDRLFGILNGIDTETLNPMTDPHIAAPFNKEHLDARVANKLDLQRAARLELDPAIPLMGAISRLTDQKGFDLIAQILDAVVNLDVQFVVLGTGEQRYHELFSDMARRHPQRLSVFLTFNAELAQKIYAGTDMFLMPSRFEPCGLGQMIAMHYGSVPIVRHTGGLADTVQDFDPHADTGTGFVFTRYNAYDLFAAIVRATETFKYPAMWRQLQLRDMEKDHSWAASARQYVDLYHKAQSFKAAG
ncbi:MAG: glycogen synthase [Chloroflexi bacterium]|nr:glycogen synthase [Chloroflexota bacterium]MBU1749838.1 glycogen synthase [Chloroflexota bacterium]MBU1879025.1 glycogen synthase [Chloroflexota bacterium]